MSNLLQASVQRRVTPSDASNASIAFFGVMIGAGESDTSLSVVGLDGTTTSWLNGELVAGVVYPISGVKVNETGTAATVVTVFGA